ncbi:hypothetical protein HDU76_002048, partial [Blyttiomyces sp. JEL0837]
QPIALNDLRLTLAASRKRSRDDGDDAASVASSSFSSGFGANKKSHQMNLCLPFNQAACRDGKSCPLKHSCVLCGGGHGVPGCEEPRSVCVRYNMTGDCNASCHREHRCMRCMSKGHKLPACPEPNSVGSEFCFAYNACGVCKMPDDCTRLHRCMRCAGAHASILCPDNVAEYFAEAGRRVVGIGRPLLVNVDDGSDDEEALKKRAARFTPKTYTGGSTHMGTAALGNGVGMNVGGMMPNVGANNLSYLMSQRLGMGGGMPMGMGGNVGMHGMGIPMMNHHHMGMGGIGLPAPPVSVPAPLPGPFKGTGKVLSALERSQVCRDYNNYRCALDKCRYRHLCLRCGGADHRERQCPDLGKTWGFVKTILQKKEKIAVSGTLFVRNFTMYMNVVSEGDE